MFELRINVLQSAKKSTVMINLSYNLDKLQIVIIAESRNTITVFILLKLFVFVVGLHSTLRLINTTVYVSH